VRDTREKSLTGNRSFKHNFYDVVSLSLEDRHFSKYPRSFIPQMRWSRVTPRLKNIRKERAQHEIKEYVLQKTIDLEDQIRDLERRTMLLSRFQIALSQREMREYVIDKVIDVEDEIRQIRYSEFPKKEIIQQSSGTSKTINGTATNIDVASEEKKSEEVPTNMEGTEQQKN